MVRTICGSRSAAPSVSSILVPEPGEDGVGIVAFAEYEAVDWALHAGPDRLERDRHQPGRQQREHQIALSIEQTADADHDPDIGADHDAQSSPAR